MADPEPPGNPDDETTGSHVGGSADEPDARHPRARDVEELDEDAPGRSLFDDGDANEPSEPG